MKEQDNSPEELDEIYQIILSNDYTTTQQHEKMHRNHKKAPVRNKDSKVALYTYLSIISLNVNDLNAPTKIHRVAEWVRKPFHIYAASKRSTSNQKTHTDKK